jgi:restriction system protein
VVFVQCKHWKARSVGVKVVRELYGVMAAKNVKQGIVVTYGEFTS